MCIYIHISLSLYIYIERERELTYQIVSRWRRRREAGYGSPRCPSRAGQLAGTELVTPSPPIERLDFRGFDSSRLLILKGGNSYVRRT